MKASAGAWQSAWGGRPENQADGALMHGQSWKYSAADAAAGRVAAA